MESALSIQHIVKSLEFFVARFFFVLIKQQDCVGFFDKNAIGKVQILLWPFSLRQTFYRLNVSKADAAKFASLFLRPMKTVVQMRPL